MRFYVHVFVIDPYDILFRAVCLALKARQRDAPYEAAKLEPFNVPD
jgi:hypothetical protein